MNPLTVSIIAVLTKTLFPLILAIVLGFVTVLIRKLSTKFNLQGSSELHALGTTVATSAVSMVEEYALSVLKEKGIKITSSGKFDMAVAHILDVIPSFSKKRAEGYANAAVAMATGIGSTGQAIK